MITKEWAGIIINKTDPEIKKNLPPGPWQDEPDHFLYLDSASGYFCEIKRVSRLYVWGYLCGYVYIPSDHPFVESLRDVVDKKSSPKKAQDCLMDELEARFNVHGGITKMEGSSSVLVPDNLWVIGFDCAHAGDLIPSDITPDLENEIYRDFDFVKSEVDSLAKQLFEYEKKGNL